MKKAFGSIKAYSDSLVSKEGGKYLQSEPSTKKTTAQATGSSGTLRLTIVKADIKVDI